MKFLKRNMKIIIGFILGVFLASSMTVYAYSFLAKDVKYTKKDGNEINVETALNELYLNSEFKTYDMISKTTITGEGYSLKKLTLKNNEKDKIMYIKVEADLVSQDKADLYTIDLTDFNINQILDYKVYSYATTGNFKVSTSEFTKDSISIRCDSNYGTSTKYDYNYIIVVLYN